jgi:hypothetical protein
MKSSLSELSKLVPPPAEPKDSKGDWVRIEHDLGLTLPDDYKGYIELYGSGVLCSFFSIRSPFMLERQYRVSPREAWIAWAEFFRDWGRETHQEVPFPVYPEIPGLLPWGTYGDVDSVGWLTDKPSNEWHIVYLNQHDGFFELHELGFTQFLVAALKGKVPLPDSVFGKHILEEPYVFQPY